MNEEGGPIWLLRMAIGLTVIAVWIPILLVMRLNRQIRLAVGLEKDLWEGRSSAQSTRRSD